MSCAASRVSVLSSISGIEKPAAASDPSTKVKCVAGEVRSGDLGSEWRLDQWRIVAITGRPRLGLLSVARIWVAHSSPIEPVRMCGLQRSARRSNTTSKAALSNKTRRRLDARNGRPNVTALSCLSCLKGRAFAEGVQCWRGPVFDRALSTLTNVCSGYTDTVAGTLPPRHSAGETCEELPRSVLGFSSLISSRNTSFPESLVFRIRSQSPTALRCNQEVKILEQTP